MLQRVGGPPARQPAQRRATVAALLLIAAVLAADRLVGNSVVLVPAVVAGPFVVATVDDGRRTAAVGAVSFVAALVALLGQDLSGGQRAADAVVVAVGAVAATVLAQARARRETALLEAQPELDLARRLRLALEGGRMGTWSWDTRDNSVDWDDALARVFGIHGLDIPKTYEAYQQVLHPDDRARAHETIQQAIATKGSFRFDHRVTWPDGSVHWVEGRGETVLDAEGNVIGATGVAIDIDERRRAELERMALLTSERQARESAERSMAALQRLQDVTFGMSAATTVDEVATAILERGMHALGAVSGYFATVERDERALVLRAQVGFSDRIARDYRVVDIDAPLPAPEVVRTGTPMFVESPQDARERYPHFPTDSRHGAFIVCPLTSGGKRIGVLMLGFDEARAFGAEDRAFVNAVVEACAQALQRALLFEAEQRSRDRLRTLLDASERLAALDDPDAQLTTIAEIAATRIGRWAAVRIAEGESLRLAAIAHAVPERTATLQRLIDEQIDGGEVLRGVLATREPVLIDDPEGFMRDHTVDEGATTLAEQLQWRSTVVVPMIAGARCIGVLSIGDDRSLPLGKGELELAQDLGRRAASAYERARLLRADQERSAAALRASEERLAAEHRLVAMLQRSVLPESLPAVPGLSITAQYRPAERGTEVGGDWYDVFAVGDGNVVVIIGDVAGHGVEAAALMGRVRNAARAFAVEDPRPAELLRRLDHLLCTLDEDAFVTALAAVVNVHDATLEWARAGHPPALLCRDRRTEFLEEVGGTPLGSMARPYEPARRHIGHGALLVLFTDGLVERRSRPIDEGLAWLASRVSHGDRRDIEELCEDLLAERFAGAPSEDDICIVALKVH